MKKFFKFIIIVLILGFVFYYTFPYLKNKIPNTNIKEDTKTENKLESLGYKSGEIDLINNKLSESEIKDLMNMEEKDKNLIDFINEDYFKYDYLNRYVKYKNNNHYSNKEVVMYVNIGLDKDFYSDIKEVTNPYDKLVLVNKYNSLPKSFEAQNLITFSEIYSYSAEQMEESAASSIIELIDEGRKQGLTLIIVSGYRTEGYQNGLYTRSVNKNGQKHADLYSARPGHSEHQTGLAVDISNIAGVLDGFEKYKEYDWVKENAHKYGFIERYPKGKEFITGYGYEPWHYRYVGVEVATKIYTEKITFEEYAVKYLKY